MTNRATDSMLNRRLFLGLGALAGMLAVSGCGDPGVTQVTEAPVIKGNRNRLDKLKGLAEEGAAKKATKKKK
jgi:hypothetical protein